MSWQVKPVGELFRVINGGTPKTGVNAYWGGPHQWVTPAEMGGLDSPYITVSQRTLTDEGLRVGAELVPANSIILSSRAPIGHLVINEVPMAFNQGCKGLVPSNGIAAKFAYYFFLLNVPLLESLGTGTTFKELSGGKLKEVEFRFPELAEQHRIAALLDEAFAGIATARANTEEQLRKAAELFDGLRLAAFNVEGWEEKPFEQCIEDVTYTNKVQRKHFLKQGDYPIISQEEAFINGYWSNAADVFSVDRPLVLFGDHTKALKYVDFDFVLGADGVKILKPKPFLHPRFFYHQLRTAKLDSLGYARHYKLLKELVIRYPSPSEQQRIAGELDSVEEEAAHLESLYTRKIAALDELKQSLLQQAFSGQL